MLFSQLNIKTQAIRKLVSALETAGLTVTTGKGTIEENAILYIKIKYKISEASRQKNM